MRARTRKLIGLLILLPGLGVYLFAAALVGAMVPPRWYAQAPFFLAAGMLWSLPAIALVRWMEFGRRGASQNGTDTDETRR
jgi:hypothetical protein